MANAVIRPSRCPTHVLTLLLSAPRSSAALFSAKSVNFDHTVVLDAGSNPARSKIEVQTLTCTVGTKLAASRFNCLPSFILGSANESIQV